VFVLLGAGSETTTHLISGSVYELLRAPELRNSLSEDWSRADVAVEEFLRFVSPVQFTKPRFVQKDIDLGGVHLKKGDRIDVDYTESVAISMLPPGSKPSMSEKSAMVRTGEGKGAVGKKISVSAEILDVDAANNKVTFKGPKGNARVVNVEDPEMQAKLPSLKPGQVVQFTYTEATAVAIQPKK